MGEVVNFLRKKKSDLRVKVSRTFDVEKTIMEWTADKQHCALVGSTAKLKFNRLI